MSDKSKTASLKLDDILQWMLDNKDDFEALDTINSTAFAYLRRRKEQW